ncbi:Crp/Fnr family transcriptional regulator [Chitinophaga sp. LS1]|uniref:Crp/Fnr family transcriptional regulator n=1 Tax=Chitinophaga sp. LS1 TaxID=3051176 RepID=UPI002AAAF06F|nr:Crp/Fnr family transcriptional regulator [Chitinophaga sp. LS1]WPV67954.1 Crp/Fnr family transcriptional regulator [Chitinophaga sp. LS1]
MFDRLEALLTAQHSFTPEELQEINSRTLVRKVRRKQLLLQEGEICQYKMFVAEGLLKTYYIKDDGSEHILGFATEGSWTTDGQSLKNQTVSKLNIEAMEDSVVLLWTHEHISHLVKTIPGLKAYTQDLISRSLYSSYERILSNISATSEEKYQEFVNKFPDLLNRVPLHLIASFLGVSRETLSRIRHAQMKQSH